jgi:hypothetical protein
MDYKLIYTKLCNRAKFENRKKGCGIYYEEHHIIPRCVGGDDTESNLVLLTAKEHLFAHRLLHYSEPKNFGLLRAYRAMAQLKKNGRVYFLTGREYSYIREEYSKNLDLSGNKNPFFGNQHKEKTLNTLKNKAIQRYSNKENHPMYGKTQSEQSIIKNRDSQKNTVVANIFDLQKKEYIFTGTYNQVYNFFQLQNISFYKGPKEVFKERTYVLVNDRYYYCEGEKHTKFIIKKNVVEKWLRNSRIIGNHKTKPDLIFDSIYDAVKFMREHLNCKSPSYQNLMKHLNLSDDVKRGWDGYKFNFLVEE